MQKKTEATAANAAVVQNPVTKKWFVLYYFANSEDPDTKLWNPETDEITTYTIPAWPGGGDPPFLFCGGLCMQPDGNVFECGGFRGLYMGLKYTYRFQFNPLLQNWEWKPAGPELNPHLMADGRWYPSVVVLGGDLPNRGKIIAMSGYRRELTPPPPPQFPVVNDDPEIYDPNTGWNFMADPAAAKQPFNQENDIYPHAFVIPAGQYTGKVFYPAPNVQSYIFDPFAGIGNLYWSPVGGIQPVKRINGNAVLLTLSPPYDKARFVIMGGARPDALKTVETIELTDSNPGWQSVPDMFFARTSAMAITLPTDNILVIGGVKRELYNNPVFTPELLNASDPIPSNWTWEMMPEHRFARGHHSTGLLLPDGRVWVSGSDPSSSAVYRSIEIYSPGYLFDMEDPELIRPKITSAPDNITYNQQFPIEASTNLSYARLIKLCATTHSLSTDMRSIDLPISGSGTSYNLTAPPNAYIAPPGLYMLFVLRNKQWSLSGKTVIPSVAKIVKLS